MIHTAPDLLKFRRFQRRLGLSKHEAVGLLECLWMSAATECPRGDIGRYTDEEIAIFADWPGDPQELLAALIETGWLDRDETYRLLIHDWHDHAPRHVKGRVSRMGGFLTRGDTRSLRPGRSDPVVTLWSPEEGENASTGRSDPVVRPGRSDPVTVTQSCDSSNQVARVSLDPTQDSESGVLDSKESTERAPLLNSPPPTRPPGLCDRLYWPSLFHDDELFAAWLDWVRHRSEIHKPIKDCGAYETLQKLEALGRDRAIAAIRYSIANGYQGVFEPKDGKKPKSEMSPEELDAASERKRRILKNIKIPGRFCDK